MVITESAGKFSQQKYTGVFELEIELFESHFYV